MRLTYLAVAVVALVATPARAQMKNEQMHSALVGGTVGEISYSLQSMSENIIHVQVWPNPEPPVAPPAKNDADLGKKPSFALLRYYDSFPLGGYGPEPDMNETLIRPSIDVNGLITFSDAKGNVILAESARSFKQVEVQGEKTIQSRQQWAADPNEALYGLGQHQFGLVNIKGYDFDLWQHNTEIAVPFLVSSKGYGILWVNPAPGKFGDVREFAAIPGDHLLDASGTPGGFTQTTFSDFAMTTQTGQRTVGEISPGAAGARGNLERAIRWEGTLRADVAGKYQFRLNANGGYKMWIDDKLVADHWRQNWLAWDDIAKADFAENSRHILKIEWIKDQGTTIGLSYKPPLPNDKGDTSLWSMAGRGIDYYVIYGATSAPLSQQRPVLDNVLAGYRMLTGKAPMMPSWAFGLWQSRQRYETQQASLDVVKGFRDRQIPFDNIVQDWMYWRQDDWGSHQFDVQRFPNPDQWIKDIHAMNAHVMISVWGKFYPTTDNYKALADKGYMFPVYPAKDWVGPGFPYAFYDPYSQGARDMFWQQVNDRLFSKGVDAWWMDATEPDVVQPSPATLETQLANMKKTAAGTGASVANAYPLLNSQAVYEGQRKAAPDQRVFILTRSGYAGGQRYAAANWSGDISATWTAMRKQIAAGLGYSISGLPYWTQDAGGFSVPAKYSNQRDAAAQDEWRELNTRWFQFAAFTPLLRVHGEAPLREMWQFGGENSDAYKAMLKADRLRYRLFPYIYSLAADVTQNDATFMRPLVMDFPNDDTARGVTDQYMFGPAFMISPVTTYKARARKVYLPISGNAGDLATTWWYDFWAGKPQDWGIIVGGRTPKGYTVDATAPYDQIPLHVRAGAIIPLGPDLQYIGEKKSDPLTLLVYAGADGQFSLYEDDGLTYGYEKGAFSRIHMVWDNKAKTLTIGQRSGGGFPGMLKERTINVVLITPEKSVPFSFDMKPDKSIQYAGEAATLSF